MKRFLLADDLTGALEVGASFLQCGYSTRISLHPETPLAADVVTVVDTETRNSTPAAAEARLREILRRQRAEGATLLFKKIDSTLRGPLGAEIAAVVDELKPSLVMVCPANPAAGRTVIDGVLHVHGTPLAETDFRHDPRWPAQDSTLTTRLSAHISQIGRLNLADLRGSQAQLALANLRNDDTRVIVSDAETAEDLSRLVALVTQAEPAAVLVGANGLGEALARQTSSLPCPSPEASLPRLDSLLVVCGSLHSASHRQIDQLSSRPDTVICEIDDSTDLGQLLAALRRGFAHARVVALRLPRHASSAAPTLLQQIGNAIVADKPRGGYFFTGGETAYSICRVLGGRQLRVERQWENVVVASTLEIPHGLNRFVFTKPGGYGDEWLLNRLVDQLSG